MGAANLEYTVKCGRLVIECGAEAKQRGQQLAADLAYRGDVQGGGEHVVAGLAAVYVIVGVNLTAGTPAGKMGDHFVGVHVGGGSASGLEDVHHKLGVVVSARDLTGGFFNCRRNVFRELAKLMVRSGRGNLDQAQRRQKLTLEPEPANGKIIGGTLRLRTI